MEREGGWDGAGGKEGDGEMHDGIRLTPFPLPVPPAPRNIRKEFHGTQNTLYICIYVCYVRAYVCMWGRTQSAGRKGGRRGHNWPASGALGVVLGAPLERLGAKLGRRGPPVGGLWRALLEPSPGLLGASSTLWGPYWGHHGHLGSVRWAPQLPPRASMGAVLALSCGPRGPFWALFGPLKALVGPFWAALG